MKITVFCGANNGRNEAYKENAMEVGKWIATNNHTLVYGGGKIGLMGVIADTVLENRGEVIGIMPQFLVDREISHTGITEFIIVDDMSERKTKLVDLGDVFIALPGGPGTLEEISQVISWVRVGKKDAPCILTLFAKSVSEMGEFIDNYNKN